MKKILYFSLIALLLICVSGCSKEENKINVNSKLVAIKKVMTENLNNYSYYVEITSQDSILHMTTLDCKEDRKNQIGHCDISTYGASTDEYIDYKNKMKYTNILKYWDADLSTNGTWISTKYNGGNTDAWLNLNDYIFNLKEESRDDGTTYYNGTIDSKKLADVVSQVDSRVDASNIVSEDIEVNVLVNASNYIERMTFIIEIMGIEETVNVFYKNYNNSGDITIPGYVTIKRGN